MRRRVIDTIVMHERATLAYNSYARARYTYTTVVYGHQHFVPRGGKYSIIYTINKTQLICRYVYVRSILSNRRFYEINIRNVDFVKSTYKLKFNL